ncbi:hypothetical protein, partial [Barnesiella intestinihominis]|uniref:hypothetical protein n=1 Tax=Barnesiella intestinihominis TaxID=487174 RepID=UPI003AB597E5
ELQIYHFTVIEARNPCLRIGDVMLSAFIFSSFSLIYRAKIKRGKYWTKFISVVKPNPILKDCQK